MKISFENPDKVNGVMTVVVEEDDYKSEVDKLLKDYRKRANVPGFRPGMVPMGMIQRQYGEAAKVDTINKTVGNKIYEYVKENKIQMLGEPMPSEKQEAQDLTKPAPYTFVFDVAVAPEFTAELSDKDTIDYYDITVDDKAIDGQIDEMASRAGEYKKVDNFADGDMLKGDIRELDAAGNTLEGGITVEGAVLMPSYIKVDDQKKLFDGVKVGDIVTFNPRKAYPENDTEVSSLLKIKREEVGEHEGDFSYQVTEINHFEKAEVNQELFDKMFGKDAVKSVDEFRSRISESMKGQFTVDSDYKFLADVRTYLEKKIGNLTFPDELLKRIMLRGNKDKGMDFVEKNYDASIKQLLWHLIKEQLVSANKIKVEDKDVKEAAKATARMQFAQYGMSNVPDNYIENYADELLKKEDDAERFVDQAIDVKLMQSLKNVVKLNKKAISIDDFNKLVQEK